jgi:hypothetical protein
MATTDDTKESLNEVYKDFVSSQLVSTQKVPSTLCSPPSSSTANSFEHSSTSMSSPFALSLSVEEETITSSQKRWQNEALSHSPLLELESIAISPIAKKRESSGESFSEETGDISGTNFSLTKQLGHLAETSLQQEESPTREHHEGLVSASAAASQVLVAVTGENHSGQQPGGNEDSELRLTAESVNTCSHTSLGQMESEKFGEIEVPPTVEGNKTPYRSLLNESTQECKDTSVTQNRSILNDSNASASSSVIDLAKKQIDASSHAFLQQIKGAAHRRKNQVLQSRDSLLQKELRLKDEQRQNNAVSQQDFATLVAASSTTTNPFFKPFKARPMPSTKGSGQAGVPKVDKKPTTTPFSPLLGPRRRQTPASATTTNTKPTSSSMPLFRARPLPSGFHKGSGQVGIPKVSKKPTTVPQSPLLGFRRTPAQKKHAPSPQRLSSALSAADISSNSLVGLALLSPAQPSDAENVPPPPTPAIASTVAVYIPHSSKRAQQRARYDEQRQSREEQRLQEGKQTLDKEIRVKRKELGKLRQTL